MHKRFSIGTLTPLSGAEASFSSEISCHSLTLREHRPVLFLADYDSVPNRHALAILDMVLGALFETY
jgi:hypothetical protein